MAPNPALGLAKPAPRFWCPDFPHPFCNGCDDSTHSPKFKRTLVSKMIIDRLIRQTIRVSILLTRHMLNRIMRDFFQEHKRLFKKWL